MRTIVLAGGYATRLHPITLDRPKPLLPVAGKPIIDHILEAGTLPGRPIVSTNRRFLPQFEAWRDEGGWDVDLVVEETVCEKEKLGTIGAIAYVVDHCGLDEDVAVIGGDNLFGFSMKQFLAAYRGNVLIALHDLKEPHRVRGRYGVAIVDEGRIVGFQEKPQAPRSTLASTACYVYPRDVLPQFKTFFGSAESGKDAPGYFNEWGLEEHGWMIDAFVFEAHWYDIGDRASYLAANREYGAGMWCAGGVTCDRSRIEDSVVLGAGEIVDSTVSGCVIDGGCQLKGVALRDCLVGRGTVLRGDGEASGGASPANPPERREP